MRLLELLLIAGGLLGHVAIWSTLANRLHGHVVSQKYIRTGQLLIYVMNVALFLLSIVCYPAIIFEQQQSGLATAAFIYWVACVLFAVRTVAAWWVQQGPGRTVTPRLISNHVKITDLQHGFGQPIARSAKAKLLASFPGNEIFQLAIHTKEICLQRLPTALEGLTITHLSDLHISQHLDAAFYDSVFRYANEFRSDFIFITGDLVDGAQQIDLTVRLLSQLRAEQGIYYILGNHEIREAPEDIEKLDRKLAEVGLIQLGGCWQNIEMKDELMILAGNSLPWHGTAPDMNRCDMRDWQTDPFRILLSHSPDQVHWARTHRFDLMLAGHTHGGQVCFPWIGPVICPSRFGGKYAAGLFDLPPTLLHVTRGISGMTPVRFRCRPELSQLVLRGPNGSDGDATLEV